MLSFLVSSAGLLNFQLDGLPVTGTGSLTYARLFRGGAATGVATPSNPMAVHQIYRVFVLGWGVTTDVRFPYIRVGAGINMPAAADINLIVTLIPPSGPNGFSS